MNEADQKVKALYDGVRPDNIESAVAQARKLEPRLTDEGKRFLEALVAMRQGLRVAALRTSQVKAETRNKLWGIALLLCLVGFGVAIGVERVLVGRGPRLWYHGPVALVVFLVVTIGLFAATRVYLRGRGLRGRK